MPSVSYTPKLKEEKQLLMPKLNESTEAVRKYLLGRGIAGEIIDYCIAQKMLFETKQYHNAMFADYDKSGRIRYAALRGTMGNFKGEVMKTFEDWKKDKVSIAKGEKAITMLEPGKEYEREDGSKGVNYNVKRVFDIIQTKDYQKSEHEISYDERTLLKSLITDAPCKMQISNEMAENINAIYKSDVKTIYVRQGMDAPSIFQALTKELAQAHMDKGADYRHSDHYIAAYCVSYMLCKRYGVPTSSFDFKSMPGKYTSMDTKEFRQELGRIRDVAGVISRDMNRAMEAMQRATEKAVPEHTAPEPTR